MTALPPAANEGIKKSQICDSNWTGSTARERVLEARTAKNSYFTSQVRGRKSKVRGEEDPYDFSHLVMVMDELNEWCSEETEENDRRLFLTPGNLSPQAAQIQLNAQTPGGYVYLEAPGMQGSFGDNFLVEPGSAFSSANVDTLEGNPSRWKIKLNLSATPTNIKIVAKRGLSLKYAVLESSVLNGCELDGGQTEVVTQCGFGESTWNEAGTLSGYRILPSNNGSKIAVSRTNALFIFNAALPGSGVRTGDTGVITGKLKDKLIDDGLITVAATTIIGLCKTWWDNNGILRKLDENTLEEDTLDMSNRERALRVLSTSISDNLAMLSVYIDPAPGAFTYVNLRLDHATYVRGTGTDAGNANAWVMDDGSARCWSDGSSVTGIGHCTFAIETDGTGDIWLDPIVTSDGGSTVITVHSDNNITPLTSGSSTSNGDVSWTVAAGTQYIYMDVDRPPTHVSTFTTLPM